AATSIVARPGDDLNALANQYGTVRLSAGAYLETSPLVLTHPVTITADPGATLIFRQPASSAPWTAAIKVAAGDITLDDFAVRFDGPARRNWAGGSGPPVTGARDNLDPTGPLLTNVAFTRLDLQGPPADPSGPTWQEAPRLMRLAGVEGGVVSGNLL